ARGLSWMSFFTSACIAGACWNRTSSACSDVSSAGSPPNAAAARSPAALTAGSPTIALPRSSNAASTSGRLTAASARRVTSDPSRRGRGASGEEDGVRPVAEDVVDAAAVLGAFTAADRRWRSLGDALHLGLVGLRRRPDDRPLLERGRAEDVHHARVLVGRDV